MQCQMQFFEVLPKGVGQGVQKVAVKIPAGGNGNDTADGTGFADIMAALMSLPADQLRQSLAQLDRVRVEGQNNEWVPLLDLTQSSGANSNMLQLLKFQPQGKGAAASVLQSKLAEMQNKELSAAQPDANQPDVKKINDSALPTGDALKITQETTSPANPQQELAAQEKPSDGDIQKGWSRIMAGRQTKVDTQVEQPRNPLPELKDPSQMLQSQPVEQQVAAKVASEMPALGKQALAEEAEPAVLPAEKKSAGHKSGIAATKAAPAALSHAAAPSAVAKPDMGESLDDALAHQRPIKKEEASISDNHQAAQSKDAANAVTNPNVSNAVNTTVQAVESPVGSAATRAARQSKETTETTAPKEMQTDVVRQIVQRMTLRTDGHQSQMQIKLKPEFLGNLRMEIVSENQQVSVRMTAENQAVKNIIEQNLHVLKSELQQHGLQIQKFDVFVSQDNDAWTNGQQQSAFRQAQDRGYRSGSGRNSQFADDEEIEVIGRSIGASRASGEKSSVDFFA